MYDNISVVKGSSEPIRARPRLGRPPKINRRRVVDAAIQIADEQGLDALSIRAVASRLGVAPMTLYGHVAGADELTDVVVADIISRAVGRPGRAEEQDPVLRFAYGLQEILLEHPAILDAFRRQPIFTEQAVEAAERVLNALTERGYDADSALDLYALIVAFVVGFTALEHGRASTRARMPGQEAARLRELAERLDGAPSRYLRLRSVRARLPRLYSPAQFERSLIALARAFEPAQRPDTDR